jgi:hypothetical protein
VASMDSPSPPTASAEEVPEDEQAGGEKRGTGGAVLLRGVTRTWSPAESPRHEEVTVRQQPVDAPPAALPRAQLASAAVMERRSQPAAQGWIFACH